jgi:hypothetical protein
MEEGIRSKIYCRMLRLIVRQPFQNRLKVFRLKVEG